MCAVCRSTFGNTPLWLQVGSSKKLWKLKSASFLVAWTPRPHPVLGSVVLLRNYGQRCKGLASQTATCSLSARLLWARHCLLGNYSVQLFCLVSHPPPSSVLSLLVMNEWPWELQPARLEFTVYGLGSPPAVCKFVSWEGQRRGGGGRRGRPTNGSDTGNVSQPLPADVSVLECSGDWLAGFPGERNGAERLMNGERGGVGWGGGEGL